MALKIATKNLAKKFVLPNSLCVCVCVFVVGRGVDGWVIKVNV